MKKMIMMIVAVLVTAVVQAASVSWNTGKIFDPVSKAAIGATSGTYLAEIFIFTDSGLTEAISLKGTSSSSSSKLASGFNAVAGDTLVANEVYYAFMKVSTVTPASDGKQYTMTSKVGNFTVPGTGNAKINFTTGTGFNPVGSIGNLWNDWTAVPEPTSMALLILGAAVFGLRRKHA